MAYFEIRVAQFGQYPQDETGSNVDSKADKRSLEEEKRRETTVGTKEDVFSLPEGDVTLQWPETLSADSYQDLEDWTKLLFRKIKRAVKAEDASGSETGNG